MLQLIYINYSIYISKLHPLLSLAIATSMMSYIYQAVCMC